MSAGSRAAVFLDRDGVINENRSDHVKSWSEVQLLDGAMDALVALAQTDAAIVLITNQSVVGLNIITEAEANEINNRLRDLIVAAGGRVDAIYMCPHHKHANCGCRKPQPGMLLRAEHDLALDMSRSVMIGDAVTDLQAACAAGVTGILVLSGRGAHQRSLLSGALAESTPVFADLAATLPFVLGLLGANGPV